ncbi:hypothetical protein NQ914_18795, partial [Acinetobacter baumannii]|nr:hypothetical protein [Acinetobacter baumannii]
LGHNTDITLLDYLADHSAATPSDAGLHLKEQLTELFSRNHYLEQQKSLILKLEADLRLKDNELIGLDVQLKQLNSKADTELLLKENLELKRYFEQNALKKNNNLLIFIVGIISIIFGGLLGKFL